MSSRTEHADPFRIFFSFFICLGVSLFLRDKTQVLGLGTDVESWIGDFSLSPLWDQNTSLDQSHGAASRPQAEEHNDY